MRSALVILVCAVAAMVCPPPAAAHDLWLEREGTGYAIRYGHMPSGHAGARSLALPAEWVERVLCIRGDEVLDTNLEAGPCDAIVVQVSSGHWTKTPHETHLRPPLDTDQVVESWVSRESVKQIEAWTPRLLEPIDQGVEIVPLSNPLPLKAGSKLQVRVVHDGRPLAGVAVAYLGTVRGTTDKHGTINIRLRRAGLQSIQATRRVPIGGSSTAFAVDTASLCFKLAER